MAVGALGFVVQVSALAALTSIAHWHWLPATILSVELAVLHNFFWHRRWTWRDRSPAGVLLRFHVSNGVASIAGNTALMALLVGILGVPTIAANLVAVAAMTAANFMLADRWAFRRKRDPIVGACASMLLVVMLPAAAAAQPPAETLAAWERYVSDAESRLDDRAAIPSPRGTARDELAAQGQSIHVPSGTISDWHGSVFIPGVTVDRLLKALQYPGTPPPQEDIVSSRVLGRDADSLRVAIRLVRSAIVTVTYDTEHRMEFHRVAPAFATARSVATRIEEVGGEDHGFLWRLRSYWRYQQVDGGVRVTLRSLSLSRNVPALVRPLAAPLVNRIARESIVRTLEALRRYLPPDTGRPGQP
jgi:putative flippase GtrA